MREPVDSFITDLHAFAAKCKYGTIKHDFIRDRLVVGIRNSKLSDLLQMDDQLTLETAINKTSRPSWLKASKEQLDKPMSYLKVKWQL